jgi:[ribosomal protein S5]-alanine N-acetyltransferase
LFPPESFETERILLRPPTLSDAEIIFKLYAQDTEVTRFLTWSPHPSVETTRRVFADYVSDWHSKLHVSWVITRKLDQMILGMIDARIRRFEVILGYVLARPYWGQGIMTEVVRPLIDLALDHPDIFRISAICDSENLASARVMEKAGMQREGLLHRGVLHPNISSEPRDCWLYAKVK